MKLIDGKKIAEELRLNLAKQVADIIDAGGDPPHLSAVLVGDDPASESYVNGKERACKSVGFTSSVYRLPKNVTQEKLEEVVKFLNVDPDITGFIVQLPLPEHLDADAILEMINPAKDVDGFHPVNIGRLVLGLPAYHPATPAGIMMLLEHMEIETAGKHCVVLGRSNIVGTPMSLLMSRKGYPGNCTVTLCHSMTHNLEDLAAQADILIAAIGKPGFVKESMVKKGAVVIDVGIHRIPDESPKGYHIVGDVDYDRVASKCSYITPVPGGVGPMTVVGLLTNTMKAFKKEIYK
ncbi:MAG: bifunctional methylenetetrahydrofolate dehydrogenase/methenyltetrahydrofolate cyclohydrolase FolD [Chloroflexota bacterium]|nr:bifunctional methylenetetrahydrofolate dehydrogenase/methenyltetrahydrofolate cyclohydrolase FolD [Lentimicrobium sp.]